MQEVKIWNNFHIYKHLSPIINPYIISWSYPYLISRITRSWRVERWTNSVSYYKLLSPVETTLVLMFTIANRINSHPCLIRRKESGSNLTVIYIQPLVYMQLSLIYILACLIRITRRIKTLNLNTNSCVPIFINSYPCLTRRGKERYKYITLIQTLIYQ